MLAVREYSLDIFTEEYCGVFPFAYCRGLGVDDLQYFAIVTKQNEMAVQSNTSEALCPALNQPALGKFHPPSAEADLLAQMVNSVVKLNKPLVVVFCESQETAYHGVVILRFHADNLHQQVSCLLGDDVLLKVFQFDLFLLEIHPFDDLNQPHGMSGGPVQLLVVLHVLTEVLLVQCCLPLGMFDDCIGKLLDT